MKAERRLLILAAALILISIIASGQSVPQLLNYQGRLTNTAGQPVTGSVNLTFTFCSAAFAGTVYLTVLQSNVQVTNGVYNLLLGSGTITPGTETTLAAVFQKHDEVWMGVKVNSDPEMTPRSQITSVPYAFRAQSIDASAIYAALEADPDHDHDGHRNLLVGGDDCNDNDPNNWYSCATCLDLDGDGSFVGCDAYTTRRGPDCDDLNPTRYPGAPETYGDGIDQDCDGRDPDHFSIDPYLQLGNQSSSPQITDRITVAWESGTAKTGQILYGTLFPPSPQITDPTVATRHELNLTALTPNSFYYYQVISGSSIGPVATFTTAPTNPNAPFRFAIIGDTRYNNAEHAALIHMMMTWKPAFYLHGGDMVNEGSLISDWLTFFQIESPLAGYAPLAPTYGNHDESPWSNYFSVPTNLTSDEWYYSWDYGSVHFIHASTETTGTQDSALFADLAAAAGSYPQTRFIVVMMHRNAYTNGGHPADENYPYSTIWGPMFEQFGVALVVQAHCHFYERFEPIEGGVGLGDPPGAPDEISAGVTYLTNGGGGAPLYEVLAPPGIGGGGIPPLNSLAAQSTYEAIWVEVNGNRMHLKVVRSSDFQVIDEFYIIR